MVERHASQRGYHGLPSDGLQATLARRLRTSDVSAFSEARPWWAVWRGTEIGARVRKSRQKEAAGAADAVLMQIEWSEAEVLKSAGVGTEAEVEVVESVGMRIDGGRRRGTGRGVGIRSGAGRTGAERGEPRRVFELWRSGFMSQL